MGTFNLCFKKKLKRKGKYFVTRIRKYFVTGKGKEISLVKLKSKIKVKWD